MASIGPGFADIVCEHYERTVGRYNCVSFEIKRLQIPAHTHRYRFVEARVRVHGYPDGHLAVLHGLRKLAGHEPRLFSRGWRRSHRARHLPRARVAR